MKYQYKDYIAWVDNQLVILDEIERTTAIMVTEKNYRRSLLANKATLERHEPKESGNYFSPDYEVYCQDGCNEFPCPTLLGVTNQLDEAM